MAARHLPNDSRGEMVQFENFIPNKKRPMFSEHNETAKFMKEELKEEVEEEKELHQDRNKPGIFSTSHDHHNLSNDDQFHDPEDNESANNSGVHNQTQSDSEEEVIEQQVNEPDREMDMMIDERITPRILAESRINREDNSFHTRAEVQSSVENLSNAMPHIQIPNEYQANHSTVNERRLLNQLMGTGSIESSDYEEDHNPRIAHGLEEQIESIKLSFLQNITQERLKITQCKKELRSQKLEFEKRIKLE